MPVVLGRRLKCEHQARQFFLDKINSPGGVHASTEDCTNTDLLLEGIGIFLSLYFAKAAWTASVCKSKRARRRRLAWIVNAINTVSKHTHTHDYQIWNVHPGCYLPGTCCVWLLGEELGRRLRSCYQFAEKDLHLQKDETKTDLIERIVLTTCRSLNDYSLPKVPRSGEMLPGITQPDEASQSLMIIPYLDWFLLIL